MRQPKSVGRILVAGVLALGAPSCGAGWHRPPELAPGAWPVGQQAEVWSGGEHQRWHAVVVGADSVSGVRFVEPATCDTCRRALPLAAVDSVRIGNPVAGFWRSVLLVTGVAYALLTYAWCGCFPAT